MSKKIVIAALALTGVFGAGLAQARDVGVQWSVTIGAPGIALYGQPAPVYQPYPTYAPAPVYYRPPVFRPVLRPVARPVTRVARWDRDRDGIPDRYDRNVNPPRDRDGDGTPNRHDRHPGHPG